MRGNKRALKLTSLELKLAAYEAYCQHVASGESRETFYFDHPESGEPLAVYKTIENYIASEPTVFPPLQRDRALASSLKKWEKKGETMMEGRAKSEPALYQMFMRNKFGWDRVDHKRESDAPQAFDKTLEIVKPKK